MEEVLTMLFWSLLGEGLNWSLFLKEGLNLMSGTCICYIFEEAWLILNVFCSSLVKEGLILLFWSLLG